jgi:hypothetical protein
MSRYVRYEREIIVEVNEDICDDEIAGWLVELHSEEMGAPDEERFTYFCNELIDQNAETAMFMAEKLREGLAKENNQ